MPLHLRLAAVLSAVLGASLQGGAVHASSADDMRVPDDVRSISYSIASTHISADVAAPTQRAASARTRFAASATGSGIEPSAT